MGYLVCMKVVKISDENYEKLRTWQNESVNKALSKILGKVTLSEDGKVTALDDFIKNEELEQLYFQRCEFLKIPKEKAAALISKFGAHAALQKLSKLEEQFTSSPQQHAVPP